MAANSSYTHSTSTSANTGGQSQSNPANRSVDLNDVNFSEVVLEKFHEYSRERPEVVAMWCFGIGFVLGWKLKPW